MVRVRPLGCIVIFLAATASVFGQSVVDLGVVPVRPTPGVSTGVAELITDVVLSECTEIPGVKVTRIAAESDPTEPPRDLLLELSVWNVADHYELITTLHDAHRETIVDSRFVTIRQTNMSQTIQVWREDLQIVIRRLSDQRIVDHIEYLYRVGNWDLAWEYILQAGTVGIPVDPTIPAVIRRITAEEIRKPLTERRRIPADADTLYRESLVWSPVGFSTVPIIDRIRQRRMEISEERFSRLQEETHALIRTGQYQDAQELLRRDTYQDLWIYTPQRMHSLDRRILQAQEDAYLTLAASDLRRMDEKAAQRRLARTASLPVDDPARIVAALQTYEDTVTRRRDRAIRHQSRPDPTSPRTVGDREIRLGLYGYGSNDPEVRYDNESVELSITGGYSVISPIVPHIRLRRSITGGIVRQQRTTCGDISVGIAPTIGTQIAELSIGGSVGIAALIGSREIANGTDIKEQPIYQGGPSVSLDLGLTGNLTNRFGLALDVRWIGTLWIPDIYLTPSTSVGVSCRYRI